MHGGEPPDLRLEHADVGDVRLAYRRWGRGPPAYLIHGGPGGSGSYWSAAMPWLGESREVFAIDLRGHGLSQRAPPYSIRQFARDLEAFARQHAHADVALVGHSFGALVALEAAAHASWVGRLVLVGGFGSTWRALARREAIGTKLRLGVSLARWNAQRWVGGQGDPHEFLRALLRQAAPLFHGDSGRVEEVDEILWASVLGPFDAVGPLQADLLRWSAERLLGQVRAEALVIAGERDRLAAAEAQRLAARLPRARALVVPDAGHSPFFDAPDAFRQAVEPFLANPQA